MQIDSIAVVFRQGAHCVQHTAVLKRIGRGQVLVQLGVLLMGCAGQVPAAVDGHPQQPGFEMLLTLKAALVMQTSCPTSSASAVHRLLCMAAR